VRHWQFGCDQPQELLARYGWSSEVSHPQDIGKAPGSLALEPWYAKQPGRP